MEEFKSQVKNKTDEELIVVFVRAYDYQAEYVKAVEEELIKRNIPMEPLRERKHEAGIRFSNIEKHSKEEGIESAQKDMLYGALWCIGGIVATVADFGYIFWGAIVFGGIQFFKGLFSSN